MELEVLSTTGKTITILHNVNPLTTVAELKKEIYKSKKSIHPSRQSVRLESRGKSLKDDETLKSLKISSGSKVFVKDLGPQIGWKTVFLAEYAGPLFVYLWIYTRPWIFYGPSNRSSPSFVAHVAAFCYALHYVKRLLETVFVHRFSHTTMPLLNLFKNCSYYWLFTAYVAYHVNHPKYTQPSNIFVYGGLGLFFFAELGNLSIHLALRNLRPPGTTVRRIPVQTGNPFTFLFKFVSCPNYTYEFLSWLGFTIMTSCLPAGIFAVAGMAQMTIWALGKHRAYKKEFPNYPKSRKAIVPFII